MPDDLPQPANPQPDIPAEPTGTPDATASSETPASPEVSSDTETSEMPSNLEAQPGPISEPTGAVSGQVAASEAVTPPSEQSSPAQSPSVIGQLLAKARDAIFSRKQKKLEKILNFVALKKKVTNEDVCKLLRASRASAFRYLNDLEKQGRLRQVGKTGHEVYYELVS